MLPALRDAALDALALVLPVECAGCGAPDRALCRECRAAFAPRGITRLLEPGLLVHAAVDYEGPVRHALLAFKEAERVDVAAPLAATFAVAVRAALDAGRADAGGIELCCVPSSRQAVRRRGFDPVRMLAQRAGIRTSGVFAPARPHPVQKGLDARSREANLAGVFRIRRPVAGRRFVLLDDVVTTGSTLRAASAELRAAGAVVVAAAALAATPRHVAGAADTSGQVRGIPW